MFDFEATSNVENRIVNVEDLPASHMEGRRMRKAMTNETMTAHHCGSKALHEIRGRNNFEIMCVMDQCGDSPPNGKMETIQVWHKDGRNRFKVTLEREDFWF